MIILTLDVPYLKSDLKTRKLIWVVAILKTFYLHLRIILTTDVPYLKTDLKTRKLI
jgi:hypothetical protein